VLAIFEFDLGRYANLNQSLAEGELKPVVVRSLDTDYPNDLLQINIVGHNNHSNSAHIHHLAELESEL